MVTLTSDGMHCAPLICGVSVCVFPTNWLASDDRSDKMTQIQFHTPDDDETFREALTEVVSTAEENGITVDRAWRCHDGVDAWEIEIVPLARD